MAKLTLTVVVLTIVAATMINPAPAKELERSKVIGKDIGEVNYPNYGRVTCDLSTAKVTRNASCVFKCRKMRRYWGECDRYGYCECYGFI